MSGYTAAQWQSIDALGDQVDQDLHRLGVGLTMGGEPTYVSATDLASLQWRYQALGEDKRRMGEQLLRRLQHQLAPQGALLHHGVGKLYPGEPFPRWALGCFWREDGQPLWRQTDLLEKEEPDSEVTWETLTVFSQKLAKVLGIPKNCVMVAYDGEIQQPVSYVLPILPVATATAKQWASCAWTLTTQSQDLILAPGPTPAGMRLPLAKLQQPANLATESAGSLQDAPVQAAQEGTILPDNSIQVALCLDLRNGRLQIFMPPLLAVRGYVDLLAAIEQVATVLQQPIVVEGYRPPLNQGIQGFQITPDPGVLEVNIHPAGSWADLVVLHSTLDQAAADCGLATIRYERDGRPIDTGGGAHITLGAAHPSASPLLRRPDLLQSLVTYWQHHPSLSYLFAGQFVGPTSQSPRIDETSPNSLDQLEMAFALFDPQASLPPEVVDHLLHHLLVDITGNTHRAAFCIDKLFPGNNPPMQLGLLELRGFAMPPDGQMRLLQMLLVRACVAWFWQHPYRQTFNRWQAALHDKFLLPHYIQTDLAAVVEELNQAGYSFQADWFTPFLEFRCPAYGQMQLPGWRMELRHALEPWPVLANETTTGGTSRPVDDTTERLQIKLQEENPSVGGSQAPILICNGRQVPLHAGQALGEFVAGVRYRARSYHWEQLSSALKALPAEKHQRLSVYLEPAVTLRFELFARETHAPLGGCLYQLASHEPLRDGPNWPISASQAKECWERRILALASQDSIYSPAELMLLNSPWVTTDLRDPRQR